MSCRKLDCDRLGQIELVQNRVHWGRFDKDDFIVSWSFLSRLLSTS